MTVNALFKSGNQILYQSPNGNIGGKKFNEK